MNNTQRGFTLLLAALVSSIVLALGSAIFLIAQKQVTLSSLGRDSQFAFYAADAAAECALYWDLRYGLFSTTTSTTATCDGQNVQVTGQEQSAPYIATFEINFFQDSSPGYCGQVQVHKNTSSPYTVIHADGYSVPCTDIQNSARALQRSVELHY